MDEFEPSEQELPGLEPPKRTDSALERAARKTVGALREQLVVGPEHAVLEQLLLDMAGAVDAGVRTRKASAAAMAAAQLLATVDRLFPAAKEGGIDDDIRALVEELREAGRTAGVRDEAEPRSTE